jgi:hypothetical protein
MQLIGDKIDFGLSWDKGSWFYLRINLNFGTPTTSNQINNSILFKFEFGYIYN